MSGSVTTLKGATLKRPGDQSMMDIPTDLTEYRRVLQKARTPEPDEFRQTAAIAAVGIFLVGLMGLIMFSIMSLIPM